jgi:pimeloyl-ACP methyl ester carboxylesterase
MALEVLSRLPEGATNRPPLLFVHGAWLGAWCWEEHFLPFFAGRGYPAHALSLRGHGGSPGPLLWASLSDYVADVAEAAAQLPSPPVLVGHSMGGGVVQKVLETHWAPGAVLLASMPPQGMSASFADAWRRHPLHWFQSSFGFQSGFGLNSKCPIDTPALAREFFFSDALSDAEIAGYAKRLGDESTRALFDMTLPTLIDPVKVKTPLLVLGGEKDVVIPPRDVLETARRYGTQARVLPSLPHAAMLDEHWPAAAAAMADWLDALPDL